MTCAEKGGRSGPTGGSTWLNLAISYTDRLQPSRIQYYNQAGSLMLLQYSFVDASSHNNGNVMGITNLVDGTRSQQFTYDQLNRLLTAEATSTYSTSPTHCWGEAYVYDNATTTPGEFGNLTNINVASSAYNGCTQESLSVVASAANQITTFSYDASGNTLNDTHNSYTWNAESEIKTAAGVTYTYDGDGDRLQKSSGKIYWYGAGSEILDESDSSGNITDEYVYFGGKRVAHRVVSGDSIYYYGEDFLGTSRQIFTSASALCYDADFYPFGGERPYTDTCPPTYKFEGKERDTETSNDDFGARYYSSSFGRWTSPDWSAIPAPVPYANLTNPQTLNLYAMVRDNPETFADLDGHCPQCVEEIAESPEGQEIIEDAEGLVQEVSAAVVESAKEDWSAYQSFAGWLQAGLTAAAVALKGDNKPGAQPNPTTSPNASPSTPPNASPSAPPSASPQSRPPSDAQDSSRRHTRDKHQGDHPSRTGDKLRKRKTWVPKKKAGDPATPKPTPPPPPPQPQPTPPTPPPKSDGTDGSGT